MGRAVQSKRARSCQKAEREGGGLHPESLARSCGRTFENNNFTEMCSGCEAGSCFRLIDCVCHSTLGVRIMKKNTKRTRLVAGWADRGGAPHPTLHTVPSTSCTPHPTPYNPHPTTYILHPAPHTPHPASYSPHSTRMRSP